MLLADLDARLDILQDKIKKDNVSSEKQVEQLGALGKKKESLENRLGHWRESSAFMQVSEQEALRFDIEDLKMSIERWIDTYD
ncbi:hypothetical protein JW835_14205 [bacterium]|nr:hypothetical protein [bacterium]